MSTAKKNNVPPEKLELYEKLVATNPDIERKGASVPYTSLNGNTLPQDQLRIRLEPQAQAGEEEGVTQQPADRRARRAIHIQWH